MRFLVARSRANNYTLNLDDLTYKQQPCKFSDFASISLLTPCTCTLGAGTWADLVSGIWYLVSGI